MRRLLAVELWEISIVTFPLLAGARVRAVKHSPPRLSHARTRAEREWVRVAGAAPVAEAVRPLPEGRPRLIYSRRDGTFDCGGVRAWRA